jgi:hypothetical protein
MRLVIELHAIFQALSPHLLRYLQGHSHYLLLDKLNEISTAMEKGHIQL